MYLKYPNTNELHTKALHTYNKMQTELGIIVIKNYNYNFN